MRSNAEPVGKSESLSLRFVDSKLSFSCRLQVKQQNPAAQASNAQGNSQSRQGIRNGPHSVLSPDEANGTITHSNPSQAQSSEQLYGTFATIKQGCGFIQPVAAEEQIYFGGRELTNDMREGDKDKVDRRRLIVCGC